MPKLQLGTPIWAKVRAEQVRTFVKVVQPDPGRLNDYTTHPGQRRGHRPSSYEITAAMFPRYREQTQP